MVRFENAGAGPATMIVLAQGLNVSGVTMWGVRLANGLAARGRVAALVLHREPREQKALEVAIDPRVRVVDLRRLPPVWEAGGDLSAFIPAYRDAVGALYAVTGRPVVMSPNLHGDAYGVAAALAMAMPEAVRIVGWQHSDIEYDTRVLMHYEPCIHAFVGVSDAITGNLRSRLGVRGRDVHNVPYGVEVPSAPVRREGLAGRAVRLIYTGRMEHDQKRILALVAMSDELRRRGVKHELTLVGDGPASAEVDRACAERPGLRRIQGVGPARVRELLAGHDALVLASRYEGLSISMLEAMAMGCVPIVSAVRSGAAQAIEDGKSGVLAAAEPEDDAPTAGAAMAEAVERFLASESAGMARRAWEAARERYSVGRHVEVVTRLMDAVSAAPTRPWPASRACAFAGGATGSGSVPAHGAARLRGVLERLAGRPIVIHGAGRHTQELAPVLAECPARVVAVADDDPAKAGKALWGWPVIEPRNAAKAGATDVVISSWMHEEAIWGRRAVYERQGLRVHRVYEARAQAA